MILADKLLARRLLAKMKVNPETGCWEWTASKNSNGYGQLMVDKRPIGAHRISYQLHRGPIFDGMHVCHHCDNRIYINPEHLFLGTNDDNMADRDAKGRGVIFRGEGHGSAKLTEADVRAIRAAKGLTQRQLAEIYGVSGKHICLVRNGKSWAHVA